MSERCCVDHRVYGCNPTRPCCQACPEAATAPEPPAEAGPPEAPPLPRDVALEQVQRAREVLRDRGRKVG